MNFKHDFDYIKINLASPKRIKEWGERTLPNGQILTPYSSPTKCSNHHPSGLRKTLKSILVLKNKNIKIK